MGFSKFENVFPSFLRQKMISLSGDVNFEDILKTMREMRQPLAPIVSEFKAVSQVEMEPLSML